MKRFSGMIRAFALVMVMVCVLCVNSFAICETVSVGSGRRTVKLEADGNKAYNYVTVCNVGKRQSNGTYRYNNVKVGYCITNKYGTPIYSLSGKLLQANQSTQVKLGRGEKVTFYLDPCRGGTNVVVSGGAHRI
ncbi:MAG: hypothetical protein IKO14_01555 [Oscillibacter sp.]|nr:hypothetical protein [Oscillibacter sp.]